MRFIVESLWNSPKQVQSEHKVDFYFYFTFTLGWTACRFSVALYRYNDDNLLQKYNTANVDICARECGMDSRCAYWSYATGPNKCRHIPFGVMDMNENIKHDGSGYFATRYCTPALPKSCPIPPVLPNANNDAQDGTTYFAGNRIR